MINNFQRKGSISNTHVGNEFENLVRGYFKDRLKVELKKVFPLEIGISKLKKIHNFDLGTDIKSNIVIECKAHTWTEGGNVPSAKLTVWNEAMYYFYLAPNKYRKIFCIQKDYSEKRDKTLGGYYLDKYGHMIPSDVEIWEFDLEKGTHKIIF